MDLILPIIIIAVAFRKGLKQTEPIGCLAYLIGGIYIAVSVYGIFH